jgi:tetratricopeptide (TPR) repeat protein
MRRVAELDAERSDAVSEESAPHSAVRRVRRRFDSAEDTLPYGAHEQRLESAALSTSSEEALSKHEEWGEESAAETRTAPRPQEELAVAAVDAPRDGDTHGSHSTEDSPEEKKADPRRPQLFVALTTVSPETVDDELGESNAAVLPRLLPPPSNDEQLGGTGQASNRQEVQLSKRPSTAAIPKVPAQLPLEAGEAPTESKTKPAHGLLPAAHAREAADAAPKSDSRRGLRLSESPRPSKIRIELAPSPQSAEQEDIDAQLPPQALREELLLARNAATQAELSTRSILEEVRAISARQNNYERKYVLNSVFAYIIFCALIFAGLYFVFELRSAKNAADTDYYEAEFERITQRLGIAEAELERYRRASHHAFDIYQLIEQARYDEALLRYVEVQDQLINPAETAMLEARIDTLKWKMAEDAYRSGLSFFNNGEYEKARDAFFLSVSHQAETPYSHLLSYHLGTCLYELGDFEGARNYLKIALAARLPSDLDAEARYLFAVSTEKVGSLDEAFELYESFLKRNRFHKHADDVNRRLGKLERSRNRRDTPTP